MGEIFLPQEILEHILQFVDGKTLLTCKKVSPEFAAAVKYLSETTNIWERCYAQEKGGNCPFSIISKLHPHNEGFEHPKDWGMIYESSFLGNFISLENEQHLEEFRMCKEYSNILDVEIHGNLILVLVKYNKDFSIYYRIITLNLENVIIDKSCRFFANMLYITPVEESSEAKTDSIVLYCDFCELVAVPITADRSIVGFPKFRKNDNFLTVEHSNGDLLWINRFGMLISKGKCFHRGTTAKHEEIKLKDSKTFKVYQGFMTLFMSYGKTLKEINTFKHLRANVTASLIYSDVLIVGTDTGMLYGYSLANESDLKTFNIKHHIWKYNVCNAPILVINVMDLKTEFVVVCCSEKTVYRLHIKRK